MDFWKDDPGPCPVDDAPHTTCTSPDSPHAIVVRTGAHQTCSMPLPPPRVFTTATYRRALHGPAAKAPATVPAIAAPPATKPAKVSERRRGR